MAAKRAAAKTADDGASAGPVTVADLKPDKQNRRTHNARNLGMITTSLKQVGGARSIVIDEDDVVLAGNGVTQAATKAGITKLRVIETDGDEIIAVRRRGLTDEQKRALAMFDNRSSELAEWNYEQLDADKAAGLTFTPFWTAGETEQLFQTVEREVDETEDLVQDFVDQGIYAFREDAIFPATSNRWGIPDLRPDRLATREQCPTSVWLGGAIPDDPTHTAFVHSTAKWTHKGGTLLFFVDDERFENMWTDAVSTLETLLEHQWTAVCAPDFSLWRDDPVAIQMYNVYRSRWCARYWQEAGVPVIPVLNWGDEKSFDFCWAGLPEGLPVGAIQCRTTRTALGRKYFMAGLNATIEKVRPQTVLVYGGNREAWDMLPPGPEYIRLGSWSDRLSGLRAKKKE